MKVGSIVECVIVIDVLKCLNCNPLTVPKVGDILTVNFIRSDPDGIFLGFDEIDQEDTYRWDHFREIQFPPDLQEQIEECLTREFELI